jgi:hypothetical protein
VQIESSPATANNLQSLKDRNRMVLRDFNATANRDLVCGLHGISRATFHRMLKGHFADANLP